MGIDEPLGDVEPEPESGLLRPRALRLIIPLEEERQLVGRDAVSSVADAERGTTVFGADRDPDRRSPRRVLRGVLDQIRDERI